VLVFVAAIGVKDDALSHDWKFTHNLAGACSESTFQQKLQQNEGEGYWRIVADSD